MAANAGHTPCRLLPAVPRRISGPAAQYSRCKAEVPDAAGSHRCGQAAIAQRVHRRARALCADLDRWGLVGFLKDLGEAAQLDGGETGKLGALFARSSKDTPADIQARRQHLAIAAFDKQVCN